VRCSPAGGAFPVDHVGETSQEPRDAATTPRTRRRGLGNPPLLRHARRAGVTLAPGSGPRRAKLDSCLDRSVPAAKAVQVKQAREQAEKEVAAFKAQLEAQLQTSMKQGMDDSGTNFSRLEAEAGGQIAELKAQAEKRRAQVVAKIVEQVVNP